MAALSLPGRRAKAQKWPAISSKCAAPQAKTMAVATHFCEGEKPKIYLLPSAWRNLYWLISEITLENSAVGNDRGQFDAGCRMRWNQGFAFDFAGDISPPGPAQG